MKKLDLTGQTIGYWSVGEAFKKDNGKTYYHCTCKCGTKKDVYGSALNNNKSLSCGCMRIEMLNNSVEDLTDMDFDKLHVKERVIINKHTYWLCECKCGGSKITEGYLLTSGVVTSCGCKKQEIAEVVRNGLKPYLKDGTYLPSITRNTINKNNTSGVTGVSYRKDRKKFRAYIKFQRKDIFLGNYDKLGDAIEARKIAEKEYFGKVINMISLTEDTNNKN